MNMDHYKNHHHEETIGHDANLDGGMNMMKMYFHFGLGDTVLFHGLVIDTPAKLCITSLVLFVGAILLEAIDFMRGYLSCQCDEPPAKIDTRSSTASRSHLLFDHNTRQAPVSAGNRSCCVTACELTSASNQQQHQMGSQPNSLFGAKLSGNSNNRLLRLTQASLQFVRTGLSFTLMLAAMTYNVCLIFAILLGEFIILYYIIYAQCAIGLTRSS